MDKLSYDSSKDRLIHVGDLIAKGSKNEEVLWWMNERRILGVRGNHDQPVRRPGSSGEKGSADIGHVVGTSMASLDGMGWRNGLGSIH